MSNLIEFPVKPVKPMKKEDVLQNIEDLHRYHVEETIDLVGVRIFETLALLGFKLPQEDESLNKKASFMLEAIKSYCLATYNIDHPFQNVAENILDEVDGDYYIDDVVMLKQDDSEEKDGEVTL